MDPMSNMTAMGLMACLGAVAGGTIYLAFLPPEVYVSWVRRRAEWPS
jgi:hypothetical protein